MSLGIKVATYNLYLGADLSLLLGEHAEEALDANRQEVQRQLLATAFPDRAAAVARLLVREQADLVGLQEVCTWRADGRLLWDYAAELLAALEALGEPYDVVATRPTFTGAGDVDLGAGPVSMELVGSNTVLLRRGAPLRLENATCGLFGAALELPFLGSMKVSITRGWCLVRCSLDGSPGVRLGFVNTHTEAYDPLSRNGQRDELLDVLPVQDGHPLVVVGDFNALPADVGMPDAFVDAWVEAGKGGEGPESATCCQAADLSNPESMLDERIDYVWVRDAPVVSCVRVGADPEDRTETGLWPSDHAGVVAEITVG